MLIFSVALVAGNGGCALRQLWRTTAEAPLPPPAFGQTIPTLPETIYAVNANGDRVTQLQTNGASLRAAGIPAGLQADIVLQRPRRFRLRAEFTQFTGRELDLGSNDDIFWLWLRRNPEPAVFFARHDQFHISAARQMLPVEPYWLIDALGLPQMDPNGFHEGPFMRDDGNIEIRSQVPSTYGTLRRVMVVDRKFAWILEQQLYGADGQLLATSRTSQHRFYPSHGVSLPHHVEVQLAPGQPTQLAFQLDIGGYSINQIYGEPSQLWSLPNIEGAPAVDLADPRLQLAIPAFSAPPGQSYVVPESARMPTYRGYERR
jgi:hypothetical protein